MTGELTCLGTWAGKVGCHAAEGKFGALRPCFVLFIFFVINLTKVLEIGLLKSRWARSMMIILAHLFYLGWHRTCNATPAS